VKYLLRLMVFVLKNLILVLLVGVLMVIAFTFAMDASNVYIVANDGMQMRADVVLGLESADELPKFFTSEAIGGDSLFRSTTYADYTIRSCDYRADVEWLWTWPWDTRAEVTIVEHIPAIDGELPISKQSKEQLNTPGKIPPPSWQDGRYTLTLTKIDGRWKIYNVQIVELVSPLPTRTPQFTPEPSATPNGTPSAAPTATSSTEPTTTPTPDQL
jgi:hypothetical protein